MPAEVRERAFEPFFTTKEPGEGTGLGLATVHGVVTDAGRQVEIDSEVGGGTVVTIFLPAAERSVAAPEAPTPPGARGARRRAACSSSRTRTRSAARRVRILEAHGYSRPRGGERRRGAGALGAGRRARDRRRDAGHERPAARRARPRRCAPGLRVVFMSGHTDDIVVRDGARHGDIAFVQKPFTRDSLLRAVEQALKPPPAGSNGASAPA